MENTVELGYAIASNLVSVGDRVYYNPIEKVYRVPEKITEKQTFKTEKLGWRIEVINKKLCLVSDNVTSQELLLKDVKDASDAIDVLNSIAAECYTNPNVAQRVRSVNEEILDKLSERSKRPENRKKYWLSSLYLKYDEGEIVNYMKWVTKKGRVTKCRINTMDDSYVYECKMGIRIAVYLKPEVKVFRQKRIDSNGKSVWVLTI